LEKEKAVLDRFKERFNELDTDGATVSKRRIYLEVPCSMGMEAIRFAKEALGFSHLCTVTGLDDIGRFIVIYHISNEEGIVLNLKLPVSKDNPAIPSVLPIYNGAVFYEREVEGILGIRVEGIPEGRQHPLPDNWPKGQYPLRKDWKPDLLQNKRTGE